MKLYRFSPIKSEAECLETLTYIQEKLRELSRLIIDEDLPINTLKIFAHYNDEYVFLKKWVDSVGEKKDEGSATSYYVLPHKQVVKNNDTVQFVGIRVPDPYRAQVGCGDYAVKNFDEFREKYVGTSPYIRPIPHPKYEMLELFHPDIDVLGYIVKEYE